ncbi:MAG: hypothetical protein KGJ32_05095 [Xanthomonadaceae bacterium]|nr:hypothetical protein [Xanthomonadaceae bacterium]
MSFISLLSIANATKATVTATTCNGCGPADLRQEALDEGNGDHYIYDFVYRKLTHYSIAGQGLLTAPHTSTYITIVPNDVATQNLFNAVQNFYDVNGNSTYATAAASVSISVPSQSYAMPTNRMGAMSAAAGVRNMTAFDMVQVPVYRQAALDSQRNFSNFDAWPNVIRAAAGTVLNAVNVTPLVKIPITMLVTLRFPDGSTSVISYDFATEAFVYVEGSSKDAVGNPIPETPLEASGGGSKTYVFPATISGLAAGSAQISNLQKMGINIPTTVYTSSWIVACTNIGTGGLPHCVAQPL